MNTQIRTESGSDQPGRRTGRLLELTRGDRVAVCECHPVAARWDVRLVIHGDVWYQERCTTWQEVQGTVERWRWTLTSKGWVART